MIIPAYIINIFYEKIRPTVLFGTLLLLGTLEYVPIEFFNHKFDAKDFV